MPTSHHIRTSFKSGATQSKHSGFNKSRNTEQIGDKVSLLYIGLVITIRVVVFLFYGLYFFICRMELSPYTCIMMYLINRAVLWKSSPGNSFYSITSDGFELQNTVHSKYRMFIKYGVVVQYVHCFITQIWGRVIESLWIKYCTSLLSFRVIFCVHTYIACTQNLHVPFVSYIKLYITGQPFLSEGSVVEIYWRFKTISCPMYAAFSCAHVCLS